MEQSTMQGIEDVIKQLSDKYAIKSPAQISDIVESEITKLRQLQEKRVTIEYHCCFTGCGDEEDDDVSGCGKIIGNGLFPDLHFEFDGYDGKVYEDCVTFADSDLELRKGIDWLRYLKPLLKSFGITVFEWGLHSDNSRDRSIGYLKSEGERVTFSVEGITTLRELIEALGITVDVESCFTIDEYINYPDDGK